MKKTIAAYGLPRQAYSYQPAGKRDLGRREENDGTIQLATERKSMIQL